MGKKKEQATGDEKWEKKQDQHGRNEEQWGNRSGKDEAESSQGNKVPHHTDSHPGQTKIACDICGLFNHLTKDCRRLFCEVCGMNNHMAYDCQKCIPWNSGPELCATQVEEQSFFYIEENVDPRSSREKDSTAIISILSGHASAKDIEREFMNIIGSETWK